MKKRSWENWETDGIEIALPLIRRTVLLFYGGGCARA